jgi:hypothetical protein
MKKNAKINDDKNLLPKEQNWVLHGLKGCKDQILISKVILKDSNIRKRM